MLSTSRCHFSLVSSKLDDCKLMKELDSATSTKSFLKFNSIMSGTSGYDKICSVCKKVTHATKNAIPCRQCQHLIHKRCANINTFNINDVETHLKSWECSQCKSDLSSLMPFSGIENDPLSSLSFNSNF